MGKIAELSEMRFGIELETVGITRKDTVSAILGVVGAEVWNEGGFYDMEWQWLDSLSQSLRNRRVFNRNFHFRTALSTTGWLLLKKRISSKPLSGDIRQILPTLYFPWS